MRSAHSKFRDCVNIPLGNECGAKARNLMHHSLAFLMQKCDSHDSSRSSGASCASLTVARSAKHSSSPAHSAPTSHTMDAETDYYLNEKHFDPKSMVESSEADEGFRPSAPLNMTRTIITRPNDEPTAQNLRKATDPLSSGRDFVPETDYDVEPEVASVASISHHSTESPQFVRYDAVSARNDAFHIPCLINHPARFAWSIVVVVMTTNLYFSRSIRF
jgi:hypothetical protein